MTGTETSTQDTATVDPVAGPKMWVATFGGGHVHPLTGRSLLDCYTMVPGDRHADATQMMCLSIFGRQYCCLYEFADDEDVPAGGAMGTESAGVKLFGLRPVVFVSPSDVALVLWDGFARSGRFSPELWIDEIVQPAEVAHQRLMFAQQLGPDWPSSCAAHDGAHPVDQCAIGVAPA